MNTLFLLTLLAGDWETIESVMLHPRCLNCHPSTDYPKQTDARTPHQQMVKRGRRDTGAPTLQCASCHQTRDMGGVPGAPHWQLAPARMAWEGLQGRRLCEALKSKGGLTGAALAKHMTEDPLVQWAWTQQGRTQPPVSQADFHAAVKRWTGAGSACPAS